MTLKEMVDHIYGRINVITRTDRPHMFIKELTIYIDFLKSKLEETAHPRTEKQQEYFTSFKDNLQKGIQYYKDLFSNVKLSFQEKKSRLLSQLEQYEIQLKELPIHQIEEVMA
jgi:hypothetical protein